MRNVSEDHQVFSLYMIPSLIINLDASLGYGPRENGGAMRGNHYWGYAILAYPLNYARHSLYRLP
jgi:hypothetical protein